MNFEKWLQAGLISLCTLALFGCAGMKNSLSTPVRPEEVPIENGLQSKLQKNQMAPTNDVAIAEYQATIATAIKKDCQAQGGKFTPTPSTGLAAKRVPITMRDEVDFYSRDDSPNGVFSRLSLFQVVTGFQQFGSFRSVKSSAGE